ncbi:putative ATP-dependent RNA helicase dhr2 [Tulasnella sp. 427]|nr:putative ATP-dependent RNA helicase dhr2 [Tulasnella sp. 427]
MGPYSPPRSPNRHSIYGKRKDFKFNIIGSPDKSSTPRRKGLIASPGKYTPNGLNKNGLGSHKHAINGNSSANGKHKISSAGPSSIDEQRRSLPIWSARKSLVREIRENDCVVILGETGSGKTTQIPQFIFEAGLCQEPLMIAITQPRRVAATSLASRVSVEQGTPLGGRVGYSVRFDDKTSDGTRIKFMTDGMLDRELLGDPMLSRYGVIIVDEAHERTLRTDLLLTSLKSILSTRNSSNGNASGTSPTNGLSKSQKDSKGKGKALPPLKVVIMSATLDAQRFSDFFNGAKVLYVKGRQHPVKVLHTSEAQKDYIESSLQTFFQIHTEQPPGDVLIFLPGQEDIESLASSIESLAEQIPPEGQGVLVCPMYAALPPSVQSKVFGKTPANVRKVVLATNIAETSITIPGVKYVIDTGLCKEKRYFPRGRGSGVDALMVQAISKSSALQRTGRAGREGEGWCFRLYTEQAYNTQFPESAIPEIQRCNLTHAILQMKCLGQNPEVADFMDAPSQETIKSSLLVLFSLGALEKSGDVTPNGRWMASFPLDPPRSRAILESTKHPTSTSPLLSVISLLSTTGKVFYDSKDREASAEAKLKFRHKSGDHLTLLNVLKAYEEVVSGSTNSPAQAKRVEMDSEGKSSGKRNVAREWCNTNFLNERALKEALDIRKQLRETCDREGVDWKAAGHTKKSTDETDEGLLRSLLAGLWQNTAMITPDGSYKQPVKIHPSSSLFSRKVPAIMYDELIVTSNTYAMGVSSIPQAWLLDLPIFKQQTQAAGPTAEPPTLR